MFLIREFGEIISLQGSRGEIRSNSRFLSSELDGKVGIEPGKVAAEP